MRVVYTILLLVVFSVVSCFCQSTVDFGEVLNVKGNSKITQFKFVINSQEEVFVDILKPNQDFSLSFSLEKKNPFPKGKASRTEQLKFFNFKIEDESEELDFNAVVRYRWSKQTKMDVDPSTLVFLLFRGQRWREFPSKSKVDEPTRSITQGFTRTELQSSSIGLFGGSAVDNPDDNDSDLFSQYDTQLEVKETESNLFKFKAGKGSVFELEVTGATSSFFCNVSNPSSGPIDAVFTEENQFALQFISITLSKEATFNAVFRYRYDKLPSDMDPSDILFYISDGTSWVSFTSDVSVNTKSRIITQGASTNDDLVGNELSIAIVGVDPNNSTAENSTSVEPSQSLSEESVASEETGDAVSVEETVETSNAETPSTDPRESNNDSNEANKDSGCDRNIFSTASAVTVALLWLLIVA